jgi:medium-chain acyl-[acyl-carrier-protein] hydrolase
MKFIWEEEFLVTSSDTDFSKRLSVSALTNMFIQVAWHHAEELGFGVNYLNQKGQAWVLSRLHFKIESFPAWNETLKLVTWPKGIRRLFYLRDLEVYDSKNHKIAVATSEWLLIDIKSKRPKLEGPDEAIFSKNLDKHAIEKEIEKIKFPDGSNIKFSNKALYSDIDLNQHLTTTRYIDWMFDTYDLAFHEAFKCCELIATFNREIAFDEVIQIKRVDSLDILSSIFSFQQRPEVENFNCKIVFKRN